MSTEAPKEALVRICPEQANIIRLIAKRNLRSLPAQVQVALEEHIAKNKPREPRARNL